MDPKVIVLICLGVFFMALFGWLIYYTQRQKKQVRDTQRIITDKALLQLFQDRPDGLLSTDKIQELTGLTKAEASARLSSLSLAKILRTGHTPGGLRVYYELTAPLEEVELEDLSPDPFITTEDLYKIFQAYDYRVSPQDLIMATGLPWKIIQREMKHFAKKKILDSVYINRPGDSPLQYVLKDPYLKNPDELLQEANVLDLEMKEILLTEDLLV
jgi:hypothetical protein